MVLPEGHPAVAPRRIGVLLVNLGTPDSPDAGAVRRYLGEFLSDRRVVEIPALIWQPILRGIILRTRPAKSAHAYQQVWTDDGSPLAAITKRQAAALQAAWPEITVDWAMRYGNPSIPAKLKAMKDAGCERILIAPLYPQYCAATTASVVDKAAETLAGMRWQPALRTLPPYHDDPRYIAALAELVRTQLTALDFRVDAVLASFHGMPQRTLELGDPYHCHCVKTARLLSDALDDIFGGRRLIVTFQSRFGRAKWLEPSTEEVLQGLPRTGVKKVAIVAPGFSADCLETLEELAIRGRESFVEAGGTHFAYLPCLNDSEPGIAMLRSIIASELAGWAELT